MSRKYTSFDGSGLLTCMTAKASNGPGTSFIHILQDLQVVIVYADERLFPPDVAKPNPTRQTQS